MTNDTLYEYILSGGERVILLDRLGMESVYGKIECARNIYLFNKNGKMIWQVSSDSDANGNPFTGLTLHADESITAYRWDGGGYFINYNTGFATPCVLMK